MLAAILNESLRNSSKRGKLGSGYNRVLLDVGIWKTVGDQDFGPPRVWGPGPRVTPGDTRISQVFFMCREVDFFEFLMGHLEG